MHAYLFYNQSYSTPVLLQSFLGDDNPNPLMTGPDGRSEDQSPFILFHWMHLFSKRFIMLNALGA